ncbi:hypothetical protein AYL99_11982 [Fonsecaea erecta]|uniref:Uncharacterized protein n=1 Tax=Fonsecaea erecta TaxID=1367422 RepID=A0A178Z3Z6_9EURO|nr:hypothetical protein AYL99_11982 [Fonsecaea erecta]OAP53825.1 hypothetical protein AYL99_11982 [Fonsecaea erecta]
MEKRTAESVDGDPPVPSKRLRLLDSGPNEPVANDGNTELLVAASDSYSNQKKPGSSTMAMCVNCRALMEVGKEMGRKEDLTLCEGGEERVAEHTPGKECRACEEKILPCSFVEDTQAGHGVTNGNTQWENAKKLARRELEALTKLEALEAELKLVKQSADMGIIGAPAGTKTFPEQLAAQLTQSNIEKTTSVHVKLINDSLAAYRTSELSKINAKISTIRSAQEAQVQADIRARYVHEWNLRLQQLEVDTRTRRWVEDRRTSSDVEESRSTRLKALLKEFKEKEAELTKSSMDVQNRIKRWVAQAEEHLQKHVEHSKNTLAAEVRAQVGAHVAQVRAQMAAEQTEKMKMEGIWLSLNQLGAKLDQVASAQAKLTAEVHQSTDEQEENLRRPKPQRPVITEQQNPSPSIDTVSTTSSLVVKHESVD